MKRGRWPSSVRTTAVRRRLFRVHQFGIIRGRSFFAQIPCGRRQFSRRLFCVHQAFGVIRGRYSLTTSQKATVFLHPSLAKGHFHRSLGHRPRNAKANESALAEGHIQTAPKCCVSLAIAKTVEFLSHARRLVVKLDRFAKADLSRLLPR